MQQTGGTHPWWQRGYLEGLIQLYWLDRMRTARKLTEEALYAMKKEELHISEDKLRFALAEMGAKIGEAREISQGVDAFEKLLEEFE